MGTWKSAIGSIAAICTTVAFVPQLLKIRRSGGRDLSYPMLFLYVTGVALWLVYGLILSAPELIAANAIAVCLVSACLVMKWRYERRDRHAEAHPPAKEKRATEKTSGPQAVCEELSR